PGNRYLEALPRFLNRKIGGRASGYALPGRAWERVNNQQSTVNTLKIMAKLQLKNLNKTYNPIDLRFLILDGTGS
ncbi:hypothetical protein QUA00_30015, partial [Microcoleus sp. T2B6]|uniref:hypothetical protein n=1 Tax=Microcoleus sp. T2B6 TaxID=3055424 RepID=UPI002FD6D00D